MLEMILIVLNEICWQAFDQHIELNLINNNLLGTGTGTRYQYPVPSTQYWFRYQLVGAPVVGRPIDR
jgi:hypothetical protein